LLLWELPLPATKVIPKEPDHFSHDQINFALSYRTMNLSTTSVLDYDLEPALQVLNLGFSDYIVPIQLSLARFHTMLRIDGVDITLSRVILQDNAGIGMALIARRGWNTRLAAMCIVPAARGKGVGKWIMAQLLSESHERADHSFELEVITSNTPAIRLYENAGLHKVRQLASYALSPASPDSSPTLEEVDVRSVAHHVAAHGIPDLPWQTSAETLAFYGPPNRAFRLDSAWIVITSPEAEHITIRSLIVHPAVRRQRQATRLLQALFSQYPEKTWHVPPIFPAELGPVFEGLEFEPQELAQYQMKIAIQ
jgi:ribosomal protein S18 acetylase RimI-like enzyme